MASSLWCGSPPECFSLPSIPSRSSWACWDFSFASVCIWAKRRTNFSQMVIGNWIEIKECLKVKCHTNRFQKSISSGLLLHDGSKPFARNINKSVIFKSIIPIISTKLDKFHQGGFTTSDFIWSINLYPMSQIWRNTLHYNLKNNSLRG